MSERRASSAVGEGTAPDQPVVARPVVGVSWFGKKWGGPSMDRLKQEGLGKGIDATKPHVLLHSQIEPTKQTLTKQVVGAGYREFHETLETISSVKNHLSASLSVAVPQMVTFKFGFEMDREHTSTSKMTASGKQILKETVLFDTQNMSSSSIHVVDLLKTAAREKGYQYSPSDNVPPQKRDLICKDVIRNRNGGVTHYISSVDLGAKVYAITTEHQDTQRRRTSVSPEIGGGASGVEGKVSVDFSKETMERSKASESLIYFVIDPRVELKEEHTEITTDQEKMISYEVKPLWHLVEDENWRLSVKNACKEYVDDVTPLAVSPGDPFLIKVGGNNTTEYLKVANDRVEGTLVRAEADRFILDFPEVVGPVTETDNYDQERLENPGFGFFLCHETVGQKLYVTARKGQEVLVPNPITVTEEQATFYLEHPANRKSQPVFKWQDGKSFLLVRRQKRRILGFWPKTTEFYLVLEREAEDGPLVLKQKQSLDEANSYIQFSIEKP